MKVLLFLLAACTTVPLGDPDAQLERDAAEAQVFQQGCTVHDGDTHVEIQACVEALSSGSVGGTVFFEPGRYYLGETVNVSYSYLRLQGSGRGATLVNLSGDDHCGFLFGKPGQSMGGAALVDMLLTSFGRGNTMICTEDQTEFKVENIHILNDKGAGMELRGRDSIWLRDIAIRADAPMRIMEGQSKGMDQMNCHNCYLIEKGWDDPVVFIDGDASISEISFTGMQSWARGSYGLYWDRNSNPREGKNTSIVLENMRAEQAEGARDGWTIWINRTAYNHLDRFICRNCGMATQRNGVFLCGVYYPRIELSTFDMLAGRVPMDIGGDVETVLSQNLVVTR